MKGGKPENPAKNPRSKDENQQQTQPTCDAQSGNRTQATLVGSERYLARGNNFPWPNVWSEREVLTLKLKSQHTTVEGARGLPPEKLGGDVRPASENHYYWRSKSANVPTLFMTWPKIRHSFMTVATGTAALSIIYEKFLMMVLSIYSDQKETSS